MRVGVIASSHVAIPDVTTGLTIASAITLAVLSITRIVFTYASTISLSAAVQQIQEARSTCLSLTSPRLPASSSTTRSMPFP